MFNFRDIGGQDKLRGIWKFYIKNCEGLFYVVDSSDRERIELARHELYNLLNLEDMSHIPVIIIANKQDIRSSMSLSEIEKLMRLDQIPNPYHMYAACAHTGEGLLKAFSDRASQRKPWYPHMTLYTHTICKQTHAHRHDKECKKSKHTKQNKSHVNSNN